MSQAKKVHVQVQVGATYSTGLPLLLLPAHLELAARPTRAQCPSSLYPTLLYYSRLRAELNTVLYQSWTWPENKAQHCTALHCTPPTTILFAISHLD